MVTIVNDILLDEDFDLSWQNGDFIVGDSDEQHLQLIVLLEKGQIPYKPLIGLGITKQLNSPLSAAQKDKLRREAFIQLEIDGYNIGTSDIDFSTDITIKADR